MDLPRIGVIVNRHARNVVRDPGLPSRLHKILGGRGVLRESFRLTDLEGQVRELRNAGCAIIATVGGDGTNLYTLTTLNHIYGQDLPPLAFLRGGTMNTVANDLQILGRPEDLLQRLLQVKHVAECPAVTLDALVVNELFCFIFGAGMPANIFGDYYAGGNQGLTKALWLTSKLCLASLVDSDYARRMYAPLEARIVADGRELDHRHFTLVMASKARTMALGLKPTYRAHEPGTFHLFASGLSPVALTKQLHRGRRGLPFLGQPHFDLCAKRATMEFPRPTVVIVDGEVLTVARADISVGPQIRLLKP